VRANPTPTVEQARSSLHSGKGASIKIAVIDSGVEGSHPLLHGLTLADDVAIIEQGQQIAAVAGEGRDVYGHGTAIAGIIRQLAPEAEIEAFGF